MHTLKVCTYNIEWMKAMFGAGKDGDWLANPVIPARFEGKSMGGIHLSPIDDVHGLCTRIAEGIRQVNPDVLFVQEGPPLEQQMQLFVATFLGDQYITHRSNRADQAIYALVKRDIADRVEPWVPEGQTPQKLWRNVPFYPWGTIAEKDRKAHNLARHPLLLRGRFVPGSDLILGGVHTKSKFSLLKRRQQWDDRENSPAPVVDALNSRQKLSAEIARIRAVLTSIVATGPELASVVMVGDFNDGPFKDLMEQEFLVKGILDELVGSFLEPNTYFKHAMEPSVLASASTTQFADPLQGGAIVHELIDHVLVSPALWSGLGAYKVLAGSCVVEEDAWQMGVVGNAQAARDNRPSDHKPVSVVIEW